MLTMRVTPVPPIKKCWPCEKPFRKGVDVTKISIPVLHHKTSAKTIAKDLCHSVEKFRKIAHNERNLNTQKAHT